MLNFNLRTKLIVLLILPIIALGISVLLTIILSQRLDEQFEELADDSIPIFTALEEMNLSVFRIISSTNELILDNQLGLTAQGQQEREEIEIASNTLLERLEVYRDYVLEDDIEDADLLEELTTYGQSLIDSGRQMSEYGETKISTETVNDLKAQVESAEQGFASAINEALEEKSEDILVSQSDVIETTRNIRNVLYVLVIGTVAVLIVVGYYMFESIVRPLNTLLATAESIKVGKLSARSAVKSQDELGKFATAFNTMADAIEYRDQVQIAQLQQQLRETQVARDSAERADQVKSAFLASMSHELRTPLNAVINFTKFVAKGDLGAVNDDQRDTLYEVVDSAKHLLNLINDVLDMSKIESGSLNLFVVDNIDLAGILNQVASTGKTLLEDKPVTIETQISSDLPTIRGDRQRLIQIFLNIMSNACKFTDNGSIVINASHQDNDLVVSIKDTGQGIALEDQGSVFEAFKQTDSGLRQGEGTGLGMPITKSLVEAHGGTIQLQSVVGEGTTITINLPIKSDQLVPTLAS